MKRCHLQHLKHLLKTCSYWVIACRFDLMVICVEEVDMVRQPANPKHYEHHYEHLGKLKKETSNKEKGMYS